MSETIGAQLRDAREKKQLTISQVAEATRIRPYYIEALEKDDLSSLPSSAQARGFLRLYTDYLGLDLDTLVQAAPAAVETSAAPQAEPTPELPPADKKQDAPAAGTDARSLLDKLRGRLTHRSGSEPSALPEDSSKQAESQPAAAVPEVFVPARYTEELPAEPAPLPEDQGKLEESPTKSRTGIRTPRTKRPRNKVESSEPATEVDIQASETPSKSEAQVQVKKKPHQNPRLNRA